MSHPSSAGNPENLLSEEKSPYLLQHAKNPVAWRAWNPETLRYIKEAGKPVFVSIGYATCHWCHVMERESFEDEPTARVLNELFVNVKVDREERPDVDQIYMQSVMAIHGQGGWPLSVWLTPDLKPFYGGTYFPKEPRWGRPGFVDICRTLADTFTKRRADVEAQAAQAVGWLERRSTKRSDAAAALDGFPDAAVRGLLGELDHAHGGFGDAPKFPRPSTLSLLVHEAARREHRGAKHAVDLTLDRMHRGGLYDHVGGGFARYSTDGRWLVPHFEKMLYDNAQLIEAYVDGALLLGKPALLGVAEDVAAWVAREMTDPAGGFYSAEDADSEGEEGKFYVFGLDDFREALGDDAPRAIRIFGATDLGNFEGENIVHWPKTVAETAADEGLEEAELRGWWEKARRTLYDWRERRPRPLLDDKVLASWNGLMIAALARLGAVTAEPRHVAAAFRAAEFVWAKLWDPTTKTLLRRYRDGDARYAGSCDDYAACVLGFFGLFEATGEVVWVERGRSLLARAEELFADAKNGGFFFAAEAPDLVARMKEVYDGAMPSANSLMAAAFARAGALFEDETLRAKGSATAQAFADELPRVPHGYPYMASAVMTLAEPTRRLFVAGSAHDEAFRAALKKAHCALMPGRVVIPVLDATRAALEAAGIDADGKTPSPEGPKSYLCEDAACREF